MPEWLPWTLLGLEIAVAGLLFWAARLAVRMIRLHLDEVQKLFESAFTSRIDQTVAGLYRAVDGLFRAEESLAGVNAGLQVHSTQLAEACQALERDRSQIVWLTGRVGEFALLVRQQEVVLERLDGHEGRARQHCARLEEQWHRLDDRTRALVYTMSAFRQRQTEAGPAGGAVAVATAENPVEYTPWTPEPSENVVEVVDPAGACRLYRLPTRPDEPTHPDIQRALATPGWSLRYPDGRVEPGVQVE